MKICITVILLLNALLLGLKEQPDCKKFKNGTYRILDTPRNYIINRQGANQYERLEGDTVRWHFLVK